MAEAQPVVSGDLRKLLHKSSRRSCQFCLWRDGSNRGGMGKYGMSETMTCCQRRMLLIRGFCQPAQQTIGILDELDCGKFDFPEIDESVERLLAEAEKREPDSHGALLGEVDKKAAAEAKAGPTGAATNILT